MSDPGNNRAFAISGPPAALSSTVLRLLAVGVPPAAVVQRVSERRAPGFSMDDLRTVLTHAAAVARATSLLPPARAAFFGRTLLPPAGPFQSASGVELSMSDVADLQALAIDLIDRYLASEGNANELPDPKHIPIHSAALQYAEAMLRQEEIIEDLNHASVDASSLHAVLTGADRTRVHELLLNRGGPRLDSLVERWHRGVDLARSDPRSLGYEEYENWLRARDLLEDAMSLVAPASRDILESRIRPLDESLLRATHEVTSPIRPLSSWQPQRWWWYRVPSSLGGRFKDRLEHLAPAVAREALEAQTRDSG